MIFKLLKKLQKVMEKIHCRLRKFFTYKGEKKNIRIKRNLINQVTLTKEQIKEVDDIWIKNYGKKIPKDWHRLYTSYTGKFDKYYFPEIYFTTNLLYKFRSYKLAGFFENKALLPYFFQNINDFKCRVAKNIVYNCDGFFYNEHGVISFKEAVEELKNVGEVIIKPSLDTGSGRNVLLLNVKNGIDIRTNQNIEEIVKKYKKNFLVQEKIKQHEAFKKLHPSSVNTIRMHTYICEGKVYSTPISMRVGRGGNYLDNTHAGGLIVGVKTNGKLYNVAVTEFGEKFTKHPDTGIVFEDYQIPKIPDMLEFTRKYHYRIPHIGIIAWDLTVDENENIVVIETNTTVPGVWHPQIVTGEAFFGENTEKMIRMLKEKEFKQ